MTATSCCRHVNQKALDQYATFTDQRTELKQRQEENAKGEEKINQLIRTLDLRKEEAIERTFKVCCALRTEDLPQVTGEKKGSQMQSNPRSS